MQGLFIPKRRFTPLGDPYDLNARAEHEGAYKPRIGTLSALVSFTRFAGKAKHYYTALREVGGKAANFNRANRRGRRLRGETLRSLALCFAPRQLRCLDARCARGVFPPYTPSGKQI